MHSRNSSPSPSTVGTMTETSDGLRLGRRGTAAGLYKQNPIRLTTSRAYRKRNRAGKVKQSEESMDKKIQAVGLMTIDIDRSTRPARP